MTVKEKIEDIHSGDPEQLEFIFSDNKRIVVEAAAGYGKTRTMVSKIAFLLSQNKIPNPKLILALTFSVNAAYKIKTDVQKELPKLLEQDKKLNLGEKIIVSNYHGVCRRILKRYGKKISTHLLNVDSLKSFDDSSLQGFRTNRINLDVEKILLLNKYNELVKLNDKNYATKNFAAYNTIVIRDLLPQGFIPYNAIVTLAIGLLSKFPTIKKMYQKVFPCIFIDEFQDTNLLSYGLIKQLVGKNTSVFLLGDSLQRIYGFIGAIPNILNLAKDEFDMEYLSLKNNYRFKDNESMLLLDYNVRRNAESPLNPVIDEKATIDLHISRNQAEESQYVLNRTSTLLEENSESRVAVLFRGGRSNNTKRIITEFDDSGQEYFYAIFSDEDFDYKHFHSKASSLLSEYLEKDFFSKRMCKRFSSALKKICKDDNPIFSSLNKLVDILIETLFSTYYNLGEEEKISLMTDTFEGMGLKQYIEYVPMQVVLTTIHGAKGLEWDYVIMPDMEQNSLPNFFGGCKDCSFSSDCKFIFDGTNQDYLLD